MSPNPPPYKDYVGIILPWTTSRIPNGWMLCFGQELSPISYPELYKAIGTQFGKGSGQNFLLPNLYDRYPMGASAEMQFPVGKTDGQIYLDIQDCNFPPHEHVVTPAVTPPNITLTLQAGIPFNASDSNTVATPSAAAVLGQAWVSGSKGSHVPVNIYSTQKKTISAQMAVTSPKVTLSPTTPSMTMKGPGFSDEINDMSNHVNGSQLRVPNYQGVAFIICVSGNAPPHSSDAETA